MTPFTWQPGDGIDQAALARLRAHFSRPDAPMGEAWFMGERAMFPELLGELSSLGVYELQKPLAEIASGTGSFGRLEEWERWYHYLLAQLLPRSHEAFIRESLLESLINGFIALYPAGINAEPYPGFEHDVLVTLGRAMMEGQCWNGSDIVLGSLLHRSDDNPSQTWGWADASGDFSASMFFCMKYLPQAAIGPWFCSVLAIGSPHWRAQLIVWLVGAHDVLTGKKDWPSEYSFEDCPAICWQWSHCLRKELVAPEDAILHSRFLPASSVHAVRTIISAFFTEDVYLDWLRDIHSLWYLEWELGDTPDTFAKLYLTSPGA